MNLNTIIAHFKLGNLYRLMINKEHLNTIIVTFKQMEDKKVL